MSNHEITFNAKLSEAPRTRADFTYKITPTLISITDTGLGSLPVTEDIEAVLTENRTLVSGLNQRVQDHVPGRQRILAGGSLGWQNRILFRSGRN